MSKTEKTIDIGSVIAEYHPRLKSFIRKRVANNEDADDILQDVFYQLIKTVEDSLNPIEQVSAWLYRVARNSIINKRIKKHEEELPSYPDDESDSYILKDFTEMLFNTEASSSPETEYLRSLVWVELESALAELPIEQREAFELTELDGLPVKGVAKNLNIAPNTLLSRKHYAVKHLRKRLIDLYNDIVLT